jgi:hypothetical protein
MRVKSDFKKMAEKREGVEKESSTPLKIISKVKQSAASSADIEEQYS